MSRVTEDSFWKERLEKCGDNYPFAVYEVSGGDWLKIEQAHKEIMEAWNVSGRVLDAACGYGRIADNFNNYVGVDISPTLIDKAKQLNPGKEFICANIKEGLPFRDREFDWAICVSLKEMLIREEGQEYWNECLKELKRVANKVLILEYSKLTEHEII